MEDVGIRQLDAAGRVVGERRFLGLFTSRAEAEEAAHVPLLRKMLRQILADEQAFPGSHDFKEIVSVFNALPKSELLASTPADVREDIRTVLAAQRAEDVAVAVRPARRQPARVGARGHADGAVLGRGPERHP
jgi:glutamate dehydrogenase